MRTSLALSALILAVPFQGCANDADTPVIVMEQSADSPYPTARIEGTLLLVDGCLMIDEAVVFWPAETSWDAANDEVVFGAQFEDSTDAFVGSTFTGGGGIFTANDADAALRDDAYIALNECLERTDATYSLLAYPD